MEGATPTPGDGADAGMTRHVGPLPVWGWAALVLGVCIAVVRARNARTASTSEGVDGRAELVELVRRNTVAMERLAAVMLARQAVEAAATPPDRAARHE